MGLPQDTLLSAVGERRSALSGIAVGMKTSRLESSLSTFSESQALQTQISRTRMIKTLLLLGTFCFAVTLSLAALASDRPLGPPLNVSLDVQRSWAQYSPYFSVEHYQAPPRHCKITQVNIIQRHGARFPTAGASKNIVTAVNKLQAAHRAGSSRLAFLANYTYSLGTEDLVPFGAAQSLEAGRAHFDRYSYLVNHDNIPFVRASSSERVVVSAEKWAAGVSLASDHIYNPPLAVILSEELNDTLDDAMCPNAGNSATQTNEWLSIYGLPIATALNEEASGANLTALDVYSLLSLCPFETVANEAPSPFCGLFTEADFHGFEYSGDLDKYYNTGYGQPLGRVQGVGYVNELLARLTGTPVQDNTQTNHTLTSSPITFPLNRTIYADFSHDNQMIAIYGALGLFPQERAPDPAEPNKHRNWLASHMVPFSAQMVTEKLVCGIRGERGEDGEKDEQGERKEYMRILVNDAVQPLEFCGARGNGLCELGKFVESQAYARSDGAGDFEKCFG